MAIKYGLGRGDFPAQCAQDKINHSSPGFHKVRMGKFLERDDDVRVINALCRQMAVRIKACANHNIRANQLANTGNQVAFAIKVILRHHCTMQAKDHTINRHGRTQLAQNFITQVFISLAINQTARLCPCCGPFDQIPTFPGRANAAFGKDGTAQRRGDGMLARWGIKALLKIGKISAQW